MEYALVLYEDAKQDIIQIIRWYDLKLPGPGEKFSVRLDEAMQKLALHPASFSFLFSDVRRIFLKRFPYLIFYKIKVNEVFIYGVIH